MSAMLQTVTLPCSFWHRSKLWVVRSARDRVRDIWASPQPRSAMTRAPGVLLSQLMAREMGRTGQDLVCCLSEGGGGEGGGRVRVEGGRLGEVEQRRVASLPVRPGSLNQAAGVNNTWSEARRAKSEPNRLALRGQYLPRGSRRGTVQSTAGSVRSGRRTSRTSGCRAVRSATGTWSPGASV